MGLLVQHGEQVSEEVVNRNKIFMTKTYMPAKGEEVNAIAFPFYIFLRGHDFGPKCLTFSNVDD